MHVHAPAYAQVDSIPKTVDESWRICGQVSACRRFGLLWTGDAGSAFSRSEVIRRSDSTLDSLRADLQAYYSKGGQIASDAVLCLENVEHPM